MTIAEEDRWEAWFRRQGWEPFAYQRAAWRAYTEGSSGLIHAPTGTGKTLAVWGGPLLEALAEHMASKQTPAGVSLTPTSSAERRQRRALAPPIQAIWITPLRALAADTEAALRAAIDGVGLPWALERRTGDTSASLKQKQRDKLPTALITTPESLSVLLSHGAMVDQLRKVRAVVIDEWHELMGTKRGVQTELGLARLKTLSPNLRIWGVSATLGNLPQAMESLLGDRAEQGVLIDGAASKKIELESLLPETMERFPWSGHLGLKLLPQLVERLEQAGTSLIFTNTRSQAETWYRALLDFRPDWAGALGLHHGSLDRATRTWVETELDRGKLKGVVCTSSLDLGIDFAPVDHVVQIGSPKGIARLMQRAGRSGHQPDGISRLTFLPTHAWELVEIAAARDSWGSTHLESRSPLVAPIDVLLQHVVTVAAGGGFIPAELLAEVRSTYAYRSLSDADWEWVLDFLTHGGRSLHAYPEYKRLVEVAGRYEIASPLMARRHRYAIGTITGNATLQVKYLSGRNLGTVEENFLSRLEPGEKFHFAGKLLELVRLHNLVAYVKKATGKSTTVPRWYGGRMPLSTELAAAVRRKMDQADQGEFHGPEMTAVRPVIELQQSWSRLPISAELLVEQVKTREGYHLFLYPFAGRLAHEGLAPLLAWRLAQREPSTFQFSVNDYGLELLSNRPIKIDASVAAELCSPRGVVDHIWESLNASELAKRQFRDIARIVGLISPGLPGQPVRMRHLQASSDLFYEVFAQYDPENRLLLQAREEVLLHQLEERRIMAALEQMATARWRVVYPLKPTPLAFPLMVDRMRAKVSSERLLDRVIKLQQQLDRASAAQPTAPASTQVRARRK